MMGVVLNRYIGGSGGSGEYASIFVTGLQESDTITCTSPSGKSVSGVWGSKTVLKEDEHTLLLLHGNAIEDSSKYGLSIGNDGGVTVSSAQKHFSGENSYYLNGTSGNCLYVNNLFSGTDEFTIEGWAYALSYSSPNTFFSHGGSNSAGGSVGLCTSPYGHYYHANGWKIYDGNPTTGWMHLALVGTSTLIYLFVNGTLVGTSARTSFPVSREAFGTNDSASSEKWTGYLQELRISDIARWTSSFALPTEPYTNLVEETVDGWLFSSLDEYGTYTFTSGGKTMTQEVDGADEYTITWISKLWLYNEGDLCEEVTGGWSVVKHDGTATPTLTLNSNCMSLASPLWSAGGLYLTTGGADISGFSTITVEYDYTGTYAYTTLGFDRGLGSGDRTIIDMTTVGVAKPSTASFTLEASTLPTLILDFANFSSYILNIYKIWLE